MTPDLQKQIQQFKEKRERLPQVRLYLGAMNDGLFLIDAPPRPSTDDINPNQNCNALMAVPYEERVLAEFIVAAANEAVPLIEELHRELVTAYQDHDAVCLEIAVIKQQNARLTAQLQERTDECATYVQFKHDNARLTAALKKAMGYIAPSLYDAVIDAVEAILKEPQA